MISRDASKTAKRVKEVRAKRNRKKKLLTAAASKHEETLVCGCFAHVSSAFRPCEREE